MCRILETQHVKSSVDQYDNEKLDNDLNELENLIKKIQEIVKKTGFRNWLSGFDDTHKATSLDELENFENGIEAYFKMKKELDTKR